MFPTIEVYLQCFTFYHHPRQSTILDSCPIIRCRSKLGNPLIDWGSQTANGYANIHCTTLPANYLPRGINALPRVRGLICIISQGFLSKSGLNKRPTDIKRGVHINCGVYRPSKEGLCCFELTEPSAAVTGFAPWPSWHCIPVTGRNQTEESPLLARGHTITLCSIHFKIRCFFSDTLY